MNGRTALITGATGGLGSALARCLSLHLYTLVLHGLDSLRLEQISRYTAWVERVDGDLVELDTIRRLTEAAELHEVDILINNAAAYSCDQIEASPVRRIIESGLIAPMLLTQALYPQLRARQGCIVNINSVAGKFGGRGETAYAAAKHGLRGFSKALRYEAREDGIRVIDVYLGALNTTMLGHRKDLADCIDPDEAAEAVVGLIRNFRTLQIDEIDLSRRSRAISKEPA